MSIHVSHIFPAVGSLEVLTITIVNPTSIELFRTLVNRATNVWDAAPPEIKEFADVIVHGKPLQNYRAQDQPMAKSHEQLVDQFPGIPDEQLPICEKCGGKGHKHLHNCPILTGGV